MSNFNKSVVYSGVVLAVGLIAIFAIRSNMTTDTSAFTSIEPAAGEELVIEETEVTIESTGDTIVETYESTVEIVTETTEDAAEATEEATEDAVEATQEAADDAAESAEEAVDAPEKTVEEITTETAE